MFLSLPGKRPFILERQPQLDHVIIVDGQHGDGGAPDGRFSAQEYSLPPEVRVPFVTTWIEQRGPRAGERINPDQIGLFVEIAMVAPQREVGCFGAAFVLAGNDVFDVQRHDPGQDFRKPAVFTTVVRPPPH